MIHICNYFLQCYLVFGKSVLQLKEKMNKKFILSSALIITLGIFGGIYNQSIGADIKPVVVDKTKKAKSQVQKPPINTTSLNIVNNPQRFLNKRVKIQATFDKFSTLGLDYSKALRESSKYIGILIQRDDVLDHNIPLSEMKLFMKKEMAEKHIDLDTGDKIEIVAKVFSTALNDPWLDIENLTVIKKVKKEERK